MTTFHRTPVKSEIAGDEPFSEYALGYMNERVRNSFYDYVLQRFREAAEEENLSQAKLAKRLGLGQDRVSKILSSPGNWTLDTVSELLAGICREELVPNSKPYLNRSVRNYSGEMLLSELPSVTASLDNCHTRVGSIRESGGNNRKSRQNLHTSSVLEHQS